MIDIIKNNKICAIMRNVPFSKTLDYARAVYDGGIRMFEIATNSEFAYEQINMLCKYFGDDTWIGAGTVINDERCKKSQEAGANFFLTPSATISTLEYCIKNSIKLLPGVMTPTDVAVCISYGFKTMKLFPAGDLPKKYIKSLQGPFDNTQYVAVGGVNPDNINDFFQNGFIGVGIGSNLVPKQYVDDNEWDKARDYVKNILESIII